MALPVTDVTLLTRSSHEHRSEAVRHCEASSKLLVAHQVLPYLCGGHPLDRSVEHILFSRCIRCEEAASRKGAGPDQA
jgi:hypothetical protein